MGWKMGFDPGIATLQADTILAFLGRDVITGLSNRVSLSFLAGLDSSLSCQSQADGPLPE